MNQHSRFERHVRPRRPPATITNEVFTISAGSGTVVSAGGPQGYTTTGTGTSTATITGTGQTSFTIGASVEYTASQAGNNTVTCNGTIYFSDGTQAPDTATVPVTAVAVDSIQLIPNPSTVTNGNETDTYNYHIGDTLTRGDFTVTTTPTGFGSYQFPGTSNYLVAFSMSPSSIQVGDNIATATCGTSYATDDVIGIVASGVWGEQTAPSLYGANTAFDFSASVDGGAAGTYGVAGGGGLGLGDDIDGTLVAGTPYPGEVDLTDAGGGAAAGYPQQITLTVQSSQSSGGGGTGQVGLLLPAGGHLTDLAGVEPCRGPGAVNADDWVGLLEDIAAVAVEWANPRITPNNNVGNVNGILLTVATKLNGYVPMSVQATAKCGAGGTGFYVLAGSTWDWTDSPSAVVQTTNLTNTSVLMPGNPPLPESVFTESKEDAGEPTTAPAGQTDVVYNHFAAGQWGVGNQQVNDQKLSGNTSTNCHLSGTVWDLESDSQTANLYPPDIFWAAAPQAAQTFVIQWDY